MSSDGIGRTVIRETEIWLRMSSPWGEETGEGEREHKSIGTERDCVSKTSRSAGDGGKNLRLGLRWESGAKDARSPDALRIWEPRGNREASGVRWLQHRFWEG